MWCWRWQKRESNSASFFSMESTRVCLPVWSWKLWRGPNLCVLLAHTDDFPDISISLYPTSALPVHFDTRGADNTRIGRAAANQIEVLKSNQPSLFLPFQYTKLRPSFLESHLQPTIKLFYSNNCYQHSTYSLTYLAPVTKNPQIHHRDQPTLLATDHHPS